MGVLYGPDGTVANVAEIPLSPEEAATLRAYKKFLQTRGYVEGHLFCQQCQVREGESGQPSVSLNDTARTAVGDERIGIACNCRLLFFNGRTL